MLMYQNLITLENTIANICLNKEITVRWKQLPECQLPICALRSLLYLSVNQFFNLETHEKQEYSKLKRLVLELRRSYSGCLGRKLTPATVHSSSTQGFQIIASLITENSLTLHRSTRSLLDLYASCLRLK